MGPCKGAFAFCSFHCLGLITSDEPQEVVYSDGNKGKAWVGIHLTDKIASVGSLWSSCCPIVVGHIRAFNDPRVPQLIAELAEGRVVKTH